MFTTARNSVVSRIKYISGCLKANCICQTCRSIISGSNVPLTYRVLALYAWYVSLCSIFPSVRAILTLLPHSLKHVSSISAITSSLKIDFASGTLIRSHGFKFMASLCNLLNLANSFCDLKSSLSLA
jgi:hypothetical protein